MKNSYVPNEKGKKITAAITAVAILVGGTLIAKLATKDKKHVEDNSSSISTTVDYENQYGLKLTKDFDINDSNAVRQRAKAIYELSDKKYTIEDIMNMIYLVNSATDKIKLDSMNEEEKFEYLQKLAVGLYDVLATNVVDFSKGLTSLNNDISFDLKSTDAIYSYMFIASGKGKEDAINLAIVVNKQINNIKNADKSKLTNNADDFYAQSKLIYNNKSGYPDGVVVALIDDIKSKIPVMGLSKEKAADLSKEYQNVDINKIWFDVANKVGAYKEADANCESKVNHTTNNEKNNANDKNSAERRENRPTKSSTTTKVETGGKPVRTEVVPKTTKKTTTRVVTSEFVVPVKTTKPTTTIVDQGGKVVEEKYEDADASKANDDIEYPIAPTKVK